MQFGAQFANIFLKKCHYTEGVRADVFAGDVRNIFGASDSHQRVSWSIACQPLGRWWNKKNKWLKPST